MHAEFSKSEVLTFYEIMGTSFVCILNHAVNLYVKMTVSD